jgi:hypothetical protein
MVFHCLFEVFFKKNCEWGHLAININLFECEGVVYCCEGGDAFIISCNTKDSNFKYQNKFMVRCAQHSYPTLMATFEHVDDNN